MSSICSDGLQNTCLPVPGFSLFKLINRLGGCYQRHSRGGQYHAHGADDCSYFWNHAGDQDGHVSIREMGILVDSDYYRDAQWMGRIHSRVRVQNIKDAYIFMLVNV